MLTIVTGSVEAIKKEMKETQKRITGEISSIRKKHNSKNLPKKAIDKISALEQQKRMYMVSRNIPVKVGNITINFKAFQKMLGKVENLYPALILEDSRLLLLYKTSNSTSGYVEFHDLTDYFGDFNNLPEAKGNCLVQESEGVK